MRSEIEINTIINELFRKLWAIRQAAYLKSQLSKEDYEKEIDKLCNEGNGWWIPKIEDFEKCNDFELGEITGRMAALKWVCGQRWGEECMDT